MPRKRSVQSGNSAAAEGHAAAKPARRRKALAAAAGAAAAHTVGTFPADFTPSEREEVERLAYFYWQERGCAHGSPEQDWFRAEEEVRRRRMAATQANRNR